MMLSAIEQETLSSMVERLRKLSSEHTRDITLIDMEDITQIINRVRHLLRKVAY